MSASIRQQRGGGGGAPASPQAAQPQKHMQKPRRPQEPRFCRCGNRIGAERHLAYGCTLIATALRGRCCRVVGLRIQMRSTTTVPRRVLHVLLLLLLMGAAAEVEVVPAARASGDAGFIHAFGHPMRPGIFATGGCGGGSWQALRNGTAVVVGSGVTDRQLLVADAFLAPDDDGGAAVIVANRAGGERGAAGLVLFADAGSPGCVSSAYIATVRWPGAAAADGGSTQGGLATLAIRTPDSAVHTLASATFPLPPASAAARYIALEVIVGERRRTVPDEGN